MAQINITLKETGIEVKLAQIAREQQFAHAA